MLLRGINLGSHRRVPMAALRELLTGAGYADVATHVQSGNVVLTDAARPARLQRDCQQLISERFGFEVPVIVRSRAQLARVVAADPLGAIAVEPKRYQVTFLSAELDPVKVQCLHGLVVAPEALAVRGCEVYTWHPDGVGRSKLSSALAAAGLGVTATARNWTTVNALLAMAEPS